MSKDNMLVGLLAYEIACFNFADIDRKIEKARHALSYYIEKYGFLSHSKYEQDIKQIKRDILKLESMKLRMQQIDLATVYQKIQAGEFDKKLKHQLQTHYLLPEKHFNENLFKLFRYISKERLSEENYAFVVGNIEQQDIHKLPPYYARNNHSMNIENIGKKINDMIGPETSDVLRFFFNASSFILPYNMREQEGINSHEIYRLAIYDFILDYAAATETLRAIYFRKINALKLKTKQKLLTNSNNRINTK